VVTVINICIDYGKHCGIQRCIHDGVRYRSRIIAAVASEIIRNNEAVGRLVIFIPLYIGERSTGNHLERFIQTYGSIFREYFIIMYRYGYGYAIKYPTAVSTLALHKYLSGFRYIGRSEEHTS